MVVLRNSILCGVRRDVEHMNDNVRYRPEGRRVSRLASKYKETASRVKHTYQGSTAHSDRPRPAVSRSESKSRQVADGAPPISRTEHSTLNPALSISPASVSVHLALLLEMVTGLWVCRSFSRLMEWNLRWEGDATAAAPDGDSPCCMYICSSAFLHKLCYGGLQDGMGMLGRAPDAVSRKAARGEGRNGKLCWTVCCLDVSVEMRRYGLVSDGWLSRGLSDHW